MNELTEKQLNEKVKILCYGRIERMKRSEALELYLQGMACCDGSERERYTTIYWQLLQGWKTCSDQL